MGAAAKKANRASAAETEALPPPVSACQATPGMLGSVLVPALQNRGGEGPGKGHKGNPGAGKVPQGKGWED